MKYAAYYSENKEALNQLEDNAKFDVDAFFAVTAWGIVEAANEIEAEKIAKSAMDAHTEKYGLRKKPSSEYFWKMKLNEI